MSKKHFSIRKYWWLPILGISVILLACTQGIRLKDENTFRGKTGVIGVFRQAAFYCSEANPHYIKLGDSTIVVKPTWSEDQDNIFFSELKPGQATLYNYSYNCGENENKFVLDTTTANKGPSGIVIPEKGFCKIVISFVQGERLFSHNDELLAEHFKKSKVALDWANLPYCEVLNTDGSKVSFADRDSLMTENYKAAVQAAEAGSCEDIRPLVVIDQNSDKVTWSPNGDKVLMVAAHTTPDLYENGRTVTIEKEMRVFSDKELLNWFRENRKSVRNWPLRMRQLLGLPRDEELTHFTTFWVEPKYLIRPAYNPDVTSSDMTCRFEEDDDSQLDSLGMWLRNWFDNAWAQNYKGAEGYPWTRLGYTYDWGSRGDKYGLSEFLIVSEAQVSVQTTKEFKMFLRWLADRN